MEDYPGFTRELRPSWSELVACYGVAMALIAAALCLGAAAVLL